MFADTGVVSFGGGRHSGPDTRPLPSLVDDADTDDAMVA